MQGEVGHVEEAVVFLLLQHPEERGRGGVGVSRLCTKCSARSRSKGLFAELAGSNLC